VAISPKPKKKLKLPTGERPKQLSILAKTVKSAARGGVASKSGKVENLTPSQAAARAGKMRDKTSKVKEPMFNPKYFKNNLDAAALAKAKAKAKKNK
jgi:hypothetical protein